MRISEQLFRTYDIRGKFPEHFSSEIVLKIGRAFGTFLGPEKTIVIGSDVRISSPIIKSVLSAGLMEAGCNTLDVGVCTTPTIYFLAAKNAEIDGGVMITASHNPIDYNGIKVCDRNGVSFHIDNFFSQIKDMVVKNSFRTVKNTEYGQSLLFKGINTSQYWQFQKDCFYPQKMLKIAVEIGNGTCYPIIELLKSKNMDVQALHPEPDGRFPVMIPDPAKSSSLKFLQERVKQENCDIGIGFDVDGDRVGFVENQGVIIPPDQVIMLFGRYLLQKYPEARIMLDVKTSKATFEYLSELGAKVKFTRVGHSWIHEALVRSGAIFAGELSGHYYFGGDYYGFDDAVYSALRMLEIISAEAQSFSEIIKELPQYPASEEIRISCPAEIVSEVVSNLVTFLKEEALNSITIDGIRAEFEEGWILIRKSGTESVISVRAEAFTSQKLLYFQKYAKDLVLTEIERLIKKTKNHT
ncbi:MAG: phosphomannomutase/phosphoglucomutase [Candidatus Heimdallarchaeota archaeon]|nr:MAG: phosphomannomutase/phosphoglucomutase [Candidatus Heimdallarchaeota archaeon]